MLDLYKISADGGNTWTTQWLIKEDLKEHIDKGYIVREYYYVGIKNNHFIDLLSLQKTVASAKGGE